MKDNTLMQCDFSYLNQYVKDPNPIGANSFYPVSIEEVLEVEELLGYPFPSQLREFYQQVGYGFFVHNHDHSHAIGAYNRLIDPDSIASIKLEGFESGQIKPDIKFEDDELPFIDIGGGGDFFFMLKPFSDNPNQVWAGCNKKFDEDFEQFIWRLYYDNPQYYLKYWDI